MAKKTGKNLVIVESPAKAKTINRYLGDGYVVKASMGHVRDLPSKGMGVDLETFVPEYEILQSRGKVVAELRKLAKDAAEIYLATDLDREGEAIAWHLKEALNIPDSRVKRVIFNAITKSEIQKAFAKPHQIDIDRVNAQQARRILDRIVGYEISPLLWRKVAKGLSAGRVQSVAVRLIVDRDKEIDAFTPAEYWKIAGIFTARGDAKSCAALEAKWVDFLTNSTRSDGSQAGNGERTKIEKEKWLTDHDAFAAELVELNGKKFEPDNKSAARAAAELLGLVIETDATTEDPEAKGPARHKSELAGRIKNCPEFKVEAIERKRSSSRPPGPFITSTLQQSASSRLSFGAQKTMRAAQSLYEAGHITYMRTDSTNLSADALGMVRAYIKDEFGEKYLPAQANIYSSSNKSAQEAHEAIRPTDVSKTPQGMRSLLGADESRLYQLIWNRFVACQMPPAQFDQTSVSIAALGRTGRAIFRATGRKLVFDGFMKVAGVSSEDQLLPELRQGATVYPLEFQPSQHFTQPPPRFSEATLVKELERLGIGRPSTYASIIQTIQDRQYVQQVDRRFWSTLLGKIVTEKLIQAFPEILDVNFTADMEAKLDTIEEKHVDWVKLLKDFYGPFHAVVDGALEKIEHAGGATSPYKCPKCGKEMLYRISKSGFFLACSDRECATTQPVDPQGKPTVREVSEYKCPICGREMIKRQGRFGQFLGCSGYSIKNDKGEPSCSTVINLDKEGRPLPPKPAPIPTGIKCDKCGEGALVLRGGKRGPWLGCNRFPKCRGMKSLAKLEPDQKKHVEALIPLLNEESAKAQELAAKVISDNPTLAASNVKTGPITTDIDCDECGKPMIIRQGRRGPFLGCSGYPKCKNTGEVPAKLVEELGLNGKATETPVSSKDDTSETDSAAD